MNRQAVSFRTVLFYAACLGIGIGGFSAAYYAALRTGLHLVWSALPNALDPDGSDDFRFYAWIITTIGGFLVGLVVHYIGAPSGINAAIDEIHREGRINYAQTPGMVIASLLSLICGSSAGPESPLVDINGSIGSWLGSRLKFAPDTVRILTFCGMGAALGAFFGSPLGSALLALELPHSMGLEYYEALIPVLVAAVIGFALFRFLTGLTIGGFYQFPAYGDLHSEHLLYAVLLGAIGAGTAVLFIGIFRATRRFVRPLSDRPILLNTLGGLAVGLMAIPLPLTLFYGEQQIQTILDRGATLGVGLLLLTALGKMFTVSLSLHSGFRGGFIFPLFFIGAAIGMAVTLVIPQIPPTMAMVSMMAAVTVAVMKTPVSLVLILSVISQTELIPLITIATMVSFLLTMRIRLIPTQRSRSMSIDQ